MRLRNPEAGTVIEVGDDLSATYLARGWVDADNSKPAAPQRRKRAAAASDENE